MGLDSQISVETLRIEKLSFFFFNKRSIFIYFLDYRSNILFI